ncbi:hypothetical protein B9Z19DRAFT_1130386 [Tuber borchii]|uniref:Uncharacterized protein n=1 Tax=Tuber borchii TaxID=42251 RepID=A0A2T6ZKQ8_TUBBO|nr:hypothetical protein B9Z19DRAFT_1130386 [Tuber borchii]
MEVLEKAGQEEEVRKVVQASHAERGDGEVHSGLIIVALGRVALIGIFQARLVELDEPVEKGVKNFSPSPMARNSSAEPPGGKGAGSRPNEARMPWLQRPAARQTPSYSNHGNIADPHLRESSVPTEPNYSEGHEPNDSASLTGEDACSLRYSDD